MSNIGDILPGLSTSTPLAGGGLWVSNAIILGQYNSLTITCKTDQNCSLLVKCSSDGVNWDYQDDEYGFQAGIADYVVLITINKWIQLELNNVTANAQSYLRLNSYGTVADSNINVKISGIPQIDVSNLPTSAFGDIRISESSPESSLIFETGTTGNMLTGTWALPYQGIKTWSTATSTLVGATMTISNGVLSFGPNFQQTDRAILQGPTYGHKPGEGIIARFTGFFVQGIKNVNFDHPTLQYIGVGNSDFSVDHRPTNGYYFGYGDETLSGTGQNNFGIVYIRGGVKTFIPKTSWNVDNCDGSSLMPAIDFSKLNSFAIQTQFLGIGDINFYVVNPSTGGYRLVHRINRLNSLITPADLKDNSFGFQMFMELASPALPATLTDNIGSTGFMTAIQGSLSSEATRASLEGGKNTISTEAAVFSIRCDSTFYSLVNNLPICIDFVSSSANGTKNAIIRMYRNSDLTGPVWTTPYPTLVPVSKDTTATFGASKGTCIFSFVLDKAGKEVVDLHGLHLYIHPGDTITFSGESVANTDIYCTCSVHLR